MNPTTLLIAAIALSPLHQEGAKHSDVQKLTVVIGAGYKPSTVTVKAGHPVELTFKQESSHCGKTLVIPDLKIRKDIELGKTYVLKFTPKKAGKIPFECGMAMMKGTIMVK